MRDSWPSAGSIESSGRRVVSTPSPSARSNRSYTGSPSPEESQRRTRAAIGSKTATVATSARPMTTGSSIASARRTTLSRPMRMPTYSVMPTPASAERRNARPAISGAKKMPCAKTAYEARTTDSVTIETPIHGSLSENGG